MSVGERLRTGGTSLLITIACLFFAFPVFWLLLTALRPASQTFYVHRGTELTLANFGQALHWPRLMPSFANSAIVATISTVVAVVLTVPSGYVLARFQGWFPNAWFFTIYLVRSIPFVSWLLPLFTAMQAYGLYDRYLGITIAHAAYHITFFSWVLKGFFESIPVDIEEAAYLDGCSNWGAFLKITLPQAMPGIIALSILGWLWSWNEFLFALILTSDNVPLLTVTMGQFSNEMGVEWGVLAATAILAILPAILFTVATQKYIVRGLGGLGN